MAQRLIKRKEQGDQLVVVVSAMGDTTDELVELAAQMTDRPEAREMDLLLSTGEIVTSTLLSMALKHAGQPAVALSGAQAGIGTDKRYGRARILKVDPARVLRELDAGNIVIVAGFQGVTEEMELTTLGRGGSDTTAVALAAALKAPLRDIHRRRGHLHAPTRASARKRASSPRSATKRCWSWPPGARESCTTARWSWPRSTRCRSTSPPASATRPAHSFTEVRSWNRANKVLGIASDTDVARITVRGVPDQPGIAATIFEPLGESGISVDTIVQNASVERLTDLTFTVQRSDLQAALDIVKPLAREDRRAGRAGRHAPGEGEHRRRGHDLGRRATPAACSACSSRRASTSS